MLSLKRKVFQNDQKWWLHHRTSANISKAIWISMAHRVCYIYARINLGKVNFQKARHKTGFHQNFKHSRDQNLMQFRSEVNSPQRRKEWENRSKFFCGTSKRAIVVKITNIEEKLALLQKFEAGKFQLKLIVLQKKKYWWDPMGDIVTVDHDQA